MKIKASLLAGLVASAPFAFAQDVEVATDPVGYVSVNLLAASDTRVSVPMHRAPVFQGIPVSVNGTSINFAEGTGIQPENPAYYIAVRSGALAGTRATVVGVDNNGDTLIIEDGVDLSGLSTGEGGDAVQLIPHWTLSTLFPADLPDEIDLLVFDGNSSGINLPPSTAYTYFDGFGWFEGGTNVDDNVILPGESFILRDVSGEDFSLVMAGSVPMYPQRVSISTLSANTTQDNIVGITVPTTIALGDSGLGAEGHELLVFDNSASGINKPPATAFEYFEGFGWFEGGTDVNDYELQPGVGYVLRKAGTAAPETFVWQHVPSYQSED